jgi:L-Ala-D/L-Glu epimerase / N-acetyl-D-glutamate racemase
MRSLVIHPESWDLTQTFRIARGFRNASDVVRVEIFDNGRVGEAECCPYPRYGESVESVINQIDSTRDLIESGGGREDLANFLPAGAARNAIDCALWDIEAKAEGVPVAQLAGVATAQRLETALTVVIDTPHLMGEAAAKISAAPLIKVKLDANEIVPRLEAVRSAAPDATLIIDANESWTMRTLFEVMGDLVRLDVKLIEQPLPAGKDEELAGYQSPICLCADESCHTVAGLGNLKNRYQGINIKLDKTGGLTGALQLARAANKDGFEIMVGCMLGTSLAMAPAAILAGYADYLDLDGPFFMVNDRHIPILYEMGQMTLPERGLWGHGI